MKKNIYFLCGGNSCRSQMAEGYAKKYLPTWNIQSAGVQAFGVDPKAIQIMAEDGVDISQQTSKVINNDIMKNADIIITLCGEARDKCIIPQDARWLHWPINDPALETGSKLEITNAYRDARDDVKQHVLELVKQINLHS